MKKIISLAIVLLAIASPALAAFQPATLTNGVNRVAVHSQAQASKYFGLGYKLESKKLGALPGDTFMARQHFIAGFSEGGAIRSISTSSATYTLTANDICNNGTIKFTPLGAATTVTLPATSTGMLSKCIPLGQTIDLNYLSIGTSTTLAAGTGGTLGYTSSSTVAAGKYGKLFISRLSNSAYNAWLVNIPN